jgi:hypothetical protein
VDKNRIISNPKEDPFGSLLWKIHKKTAATVFFY